MKKQLLLVTALLAGATSVTAQTWTSSDEPAVGASTILYVVDSLAPNFANLTGADQTWDYSDISGYNDNSKVVSILDPSTTMYASEFPSSTRVMDIPGYMQMFQTISTEEKLTQGIILPIDGFGDAIIEFNANNQKALEYPATSTTSFMDDFSGTFTFGADSQPASGDIFVAVDGTGTLLLPGEVIYSDVMRIHTIDTTYTAIDAGLGIPLSVMIVRNQYDYMKASVSAFPLFSHNSVKVFVTGFPDEILLGVVLSSENPTTFVGTSELGNLSSFNVYPNPSNGEVFITVPSVDESSAITVYDAVGKEIHSVKVTSTTTTVSLHNEPKGVYFVRMTSAGEQKTAKLVLK
jgi:hypothetical protein